MRTAIVCWWYGKADRGMETLAYNLERRLPGEIRILSSTNVPGKKYGFWRTFIRTIHVTKLYRFCWQIEKLIPWFDVFNEDFLDVLSLCRNMDKSLDKFQPNIIINLSGSLTSFYLNRYRSRTGIPFISALVAGKCLTEIKNCRNEPDCYLVYCPSHLEYFKSRFPDLRIELVMMGAGL